MAVHTMEKKSMSRPKPIASFRNGRLGLISVLVLVIMRISSSSRNTGFITNMIHNGRAPDTRDASSCLHKYAVIESTREIMERGQRQVRRLPSMIRGMRLRTNVPVLCSSGGAPSWIAWPGR
jgi:hypothetical protein